MAWVQYNGASYWVSRRRLPTADAGYLEKRARQAARRESKALLRRIWGEARGYWPHIGGLFVLNLLATPLALLTPLPLKIAVDSVLGSHPVPHFLDPLLPGEKAKTALLVMTAVLVVLIAACVYLENTSIWVLQSYTGEMVTLGFRKKLFDRAQRLSLSYHDSKGAADSTYRIQYDAPAIRYVAVDGTIPLITAGLTLLGMAYVMARLDWQLALVALGVSPLLFWLAKSSMGPLRRRWQDIKQQESSAMSVVQESLSAMRVVKAFGQEDRERERFVRRSAKTVRGQVRVALIQGGVQFVIGVVIAIGTGAVLLIGILHVKSHVLTLGELLLIMGYITQLYTPMQTLNKGIATLQAGLVSAERAFTLLDADPDVIERPRAHHVSRAAGAIAFRRVSFGYEVDNPVLHEISFEVAPGNRIGIAGTTGAGKTTLVSLLTRFYDPTEGLILLDGIDIRDYRLADLRSQFAIVLQEPVLFSDTIAENIAYARPNATVSEIIEAAKAANAHEFIVELPDGYETEVGERGMRLSGGERQRISLARAFLRDAPILLLDEPTSSVDVKTEAKIMEAMQRLMAGRTTFLIAHRLSTLTGCDLRLHIEDGRLVDPLQPYDGIGGGVTDLEPNATAAEVAADSHIQPA